MGLRRRGRYQGIIQCISFLLSVNKTKIVARFFWKNGSIIITILSQFSMVLDIYPIFFWMPISLYVSEHFPTYTVTNLVHHQKKSLLINKLIIFVCREIFKNQENSFTGLFNLIYLLLCVKSKKIAWGVCECDFSIQIFSAFPFYVYVFFNLAFKNFTIH